MRSGINILDDGILFMRIEVRWPDNNPPDVCLPITSFSRKYLRCFPTCSQQVAVICTLQLHDNFSFPVPQDCRRSFIDTGIDVYKIAKVLVEKCRVVCVFLRQFTQVLPVEPNTIIMNQVRISFLVLSASLKNNLLSRFIHVYDPAHHPVSPRDLVDYGPCLSVIAIQMVPAITFRGPDNLLSIAKVLSVTLSAIVDKCFADLVNQITAPSSGSV